MGEWTLRSVVDDRFGDNGHNLYVPEGRNSHKPGAIPGIPPAVLRYLLYGVVNSENPKDIAILFEALYALWLGREIMVPPPTSEVLGMCGPRKHKDSHLLFVAPEFSRPDSLAQLSAGIGIDLEFRRSIRRRHGCGLLRQGACGIEREIENALLSGWIWTTADVLYPHCEETSYYPWFYATIGSQGDVRAMTLNSQLILLGYLESVYGYTLGRYTRTYLLGSTYRDQDTKRSYPLVMYRDSLFDTIRLRAAGPIPQHEGSGCALSLAMISAAG